MFGKISDFFKPLFSKSDTMPSSAIPSLRRAGDDERKDRPKSRQDRHATAHEPDVFAADVTVFSLPAIRAGLMEGAGSISDTDLTRALGLIDALSRAGVRGVPVAEGQGLIDALEKASTLLRGNV